MPTKKIANKKRLAKIAGRKRNPRQPVAVVFQDLYLGSFLRRRLLIFLISA
jgi:ribosomal protein L39E